ncbi:hypothetical protein Halhy_3398 [Haliscomenobacter hydrossis DSM 1100]|uniref:Uncharacterized protein n=2 Tax=Haliscomenobacter TaxID=2349 RepID=F4KVE1_HALH1|nr:hypothetical protein Halhy_3398 [Haliscomenobacter hydrossis DSM 1100]
MNRKPSCKFYAMRFALIGLLLPTLSVFSPPILARTINACSIQDTTPSAPAKKISVLLVIIDKDITTVEMEALEKIELPLNKKIVFTVDAKGKLKGFDLNSGAGGCGITVDEQELYPLVIHGVEGGCGTRSFDLAQLEKIHAGLIPENTQVILGGIPQDPQGFDAYKAKMLGIQYDEHKKRVAELEAKNWEEVTEDAHDTFSAPVSDAGIQNITTRMERCLNANKELMVVINNGKPQSSIPALKELNIKRMETHRKSKFYYLQGTTQIVRSEWLGLRVEIFTE